MKANYKKYASFDVGMYFSGIRYDRAVTPARNRPQNGSTYAMMSPKRLVIYKKAEVLDFAGQSICPLAKNLYLVLEIDINRLKFISNKVYALRKYMVL